MSSSKRDPTRPGRRRITVVAVIAAILLAAAVAIPAVVEVVRGLRSGPGETVAAGDPVTMRGSGCAAGAEVSLRLDTGASLGSTTATGAGLFSATVTIPPSTPAGEHTVAAACIGPAGLVAQTLELTVTAADQPQPPTNHSRSP